MIQIYSKGNTNYTKNGDAVLFPTECRLKAKLNDAWEMELVHPVDQDGRWKHICEEAVIAAPTFQGKKQLFRTDKVEKDDDEVTAVAYPIFFDSMDDCFLLDVRPTAKNGQEALDIMMDGSKYSGQSDITTASTAYFVRRNLMSAINGKEEPSFISRWGGEILYDNHTVIINERVGGNYGVEVRYGKNMSGIDYQVDMADVVTRIIPVAYNGHMLSGDSPWVDSPNIGKYAKIYTREVKFDDVKLKEDAGEDEVSYDTLEDLRVELRKRCNELYSGGVDLPKVTIKIDVVDLSECEEYAEYADIEKIGLGDTVKCYNSRLDITTEARAIEIEWDCIRDAAGEIVLGDFEYNFFSNISSALNEIDVISGAIGRDGSVAAEKVRGFLDAAKTQLRLQNSVAKKQDVRAIQVEDLDPNSELYGSMVFGTQGLQISRERTADGRDWEWSTALTANGMIANIIVAGILSDKKGLNTWDLDTGEMNMHVMSIVADEFSLSSGDTIEDIAKGIIDGQTQADIIDKLSNGGKDNGIYIKDGKLYISFSAMRGEILTLGGANNLNGKIIMLDAGGEQCGSWTNEGLQASGDLEIRKIYNSIGDYYEARMDLIDDVHYGENTYSCYGLRIGTNTKNSMQGYGEILLIPTKTINPNSTPGYGNLIYSNTGISIVSRRYPGTSSDGHSEIRMLGKSMHLTANGTQFLVYAPNKGEQIQGLVRMPTGIIVEDTSLFKDVGNTSTEVNAAFEYVKGGSHTYRSLKLNGTSSKRYKDIGRAMDSSDVECLYNITPVWAKYKDGYLSENDERCGIEYPMFVAEDVEKYAPLAVDHNKDGLAENWNNRIMVPYMFQMIKSQKETIDNLTERLERLEKLLVEGSE